MYEYTYKKIEVKGMITLNPTEDYHDIINEYAKKGWRLVQIFAPSLAGYGTAKYFELIFEKQIE